MAKKKTGTTGIGQFTTNQHGLNKQHWTERQGEMGAKRNLDKNVTANQHDSGQGDGGRTGPIKFGVDE
jgi:hypothetical protein